MVTRSVVAGTQLSPEIGTNHAAADIVVPLPRSTRKVTAVFSSDECLNSVTGLPAPLRILCRLTSGNRQSRPRQPLS
jgi:hypothetical protein